jgi:hypothetical protein
MSSVSDHIQLMKSSDFKYDSVFNKKNGCISMIQPPNMTKAPQLLKQHHWVIILNFLIIMLDIYQFQL